MPAETDVKLAADLADFRLETEKRLGALEKDLAGFRSSVETELGMIRKLGDRLLGVGVAIVGTIIVGEATIAWAASAVVSDVKHQGERIDKIDDRLDQVGKRLDSIDANLDLLIRHGETKTKGE